MPTMTVQLFTPPATNVVETNWNGSISTSTTKGSKIEMRFIQRAWTNTPLFLRKRVKGKMKRTTLAALPDNSLTHLQRECTGMGLGQFWVLPDSWYPNQKWYMTGNALFPSQEALDLNDPRFTALYNKAVSKLPQRMNGDSFNLPLFVAEARKSVTMIGTAARDISNLLKTCKTDRQIHNLWLEYRYGWRLLLKDIYDILVVIHSIRTKGIHQRVTSSATASWPTPKHLFFNGLVGNPSKGVSCQTMRTCKDDLTVRITLKYSDDTPITGTLAQLGISNPFLLSWELIPYSFVVDWFIPVGDYLAGVDSYLGKSFRGGCISYSFNRTSIYEAGNATVDINSYPRGVVTKKIVEPLHASARSYKRVPLVSFPVTQLPFIRPDLNLSRVVDGVSLLLQQKDRLDSSYAAAQRGNDVLKYQENPALKKSRVRLV